MLDLSGFIFVLSQSNRVDFECRPFNRLGTSPHIFFSWNFVSKPLVFGERLLPGKAHRCWFQAVPHHRPCKATELISSADPSTTWVHLHDIHFSVAMTSQRPLDHATNNTPNPAQNQPPTPNPRKKLSPGAGTRSEARAETRTGPKPGTSPSPPPHQRPGDPHILCRLRRSSSRTGRPLPGPRRRPP